MNGTIEIKAWGDHNCCINMDMEDMTRTDKLVILDTLTDIFHLSPHDKKVVGMTIAKGGIGAVFGVAPTKIKIDCDKIIGKEKHNETDED